MSFDSLAFTIFFIALLVVYNLVEQKKKPYLLLGGSYLFYTSINLAFLPLILFSTTTDYFCGLGIRKHPVHKKKLLSLSLLLNLGMLFFFKYYIFAAENFNNLFDVLGLGYSLPLIKVFFPVGISFYTIQTIGYTIDVYRDRIEPEENFVRFALFVCFFPQLIAGPLERAKNLIHQFSSPLKLDYFLTQKYVFFIMLGLVKKTVVSDRLFEVIKHNISNPLQLEQASKNFTSFFLMYYRLYYDFSSYSIMAVGIAGLLGIKLSRNFYHPFYTTNIADFWRQWHITLHQWLKDYVYKPLREKNYNKIFAIYVVFVVSGIWHGAAWNFIVWGAMNATYLLFYNASIKPFLEKQKWANTYSFRFACFCFNHLLIAITTPFYFLKNIKLSYHFIINGFRFEFFQLSTYWNSIPKDLQVDFGISMGVFLFLEVFSFYAYFKSRKVEDYKEKKHLINGAIAILFLLTFFLSKESGPLFRYYFF